MKSAGILKGLTLCLVALGVCLTGAVQAASPASGPVVQDIALAQGGLFVGQLVDAQDPRGGQAGGPEPDVPDHLGSG